MEFEFPWKLVKDFLFDLLVIVLVDLIMAWPIMFAWNCVVPALSKLPELGYWQIFSLMFLMMIVKNTFYPSKS